MKLATKVVLRMLTDSGKISGGASGGNIILNNSVAMIHRAGNVYYVYSLVYMST